MKQYKLKKWYPSLAISWRTDDMFEYDANNEVMTNISNVKNGFAKPKQIIIKKAELHPDFWQLIEEKNERGYYKKYHISKNDGSSINPDADYFVLRLDTDVHARKALRQYAESIRSENASFADDIIQKVTFYEEKNPLFITEDGVEITDGMQSVIAIDSDINVEHTRYQWANKKDLIFGSKEGADEYIWRNKPVFSYNDFMKWGNVPFPKAIEQLAKERIEG